MHNPVYELISTIDDSPLDLDLIKKHLRVPLGITSNDLYIAQLTSSVVDFFQCRTNTILLTTTYRLYLDCFIEEIKIRRKPNITITSIEYLKDSVLTVVPAIDYYQIFSNNYPTVQPVEGTDWPSDVDDRKQAVHINFTAGYGANFDAIPQKLKIALLQHIANLYENRGDCADCAALMPVGARAIYDSYIVNDISIGCNHD